MAGGGAVNHSTTQPLKQSIGLRSFKLLEGLMKVLGLLVKTNHMPVRFLIYVAITALTRLLISNVSHHNPPDMGVVYLTGAILLLAFAILVVRYASSQFPSVKIENPHRKTGAGSGEHPEVEKGEL